MVLNIQISDVGLVLDLVGAILLFAYGLAPLLSRDGSMSLSTGTSDYLKRKAKKYETFSRAGIGLIFIGFALQLLGNHVNWSQDVELTAVVFALLVLSLLTILFEVARRNWRRKYELEVYYTPQFDKTTPSYSREHMWVFKITNNSRSLLTAMLHLKSKPDAITLLENEEQARSIDPVRRIELKDIEPSKLASIQVWGMGGHVTDGLDCYLRVGKKIVRPKVSHPEKDEE